MQESIQTLTEKIYREGITKAEEDGAKIISEAKEKAREIVERAEAKAAEIVANAEKKAADTKLRVDAEMRLSARQAIGELKQRITEMLIGDITKQPVAEAFDDTEFVKRLIEKLVEYWVARFGREEQLHILLPESDFKDYQNFLQSSARELLEKGVTVAFSGKMKDGFQIHTEDNRFRVSFTSEDFENYFRTYARPRTYKLLFGEEA